MRSILIVEDEPFLLDFLAEEFTDEDWTVYRAESSVQAFAQLAEQEVEAVLTDLNVSPRGNEAYLCELGEKLKDPARQLFIHSGGAGRYPDIPHARIFNKPVAIESVLGHLNSCFPVEGS